MCDMLRSEFSVFYMDDEILGGKYEDIFHDHRTIEAEGSTLGFELCWKKTELTFKNPTSGGLSSYPSRS